MASVLRHYTLTAGATPLTLDLGTNVFAILLRCPSGNAGTCYVQLDEVPANATYGTPLIAGESIVIDISSAIQTIAQRDGTPSAEKFIRTLAYIASVAAQTINVEVLQWV